MAITPWIQGDTVPPWTIPLVPDSGPFNTTPLTTSSFALTLHNTDDNTITNGAGTFTNLTAAVVSGNTVVTPASITYNPVSADVATLGNYLLYLVVTYPTGGIETLSLGQWQVIAK